MLSSPILHAPDDRLTSMAHIDVLHGDLLLPTLPELLQGQEPQLKNRHEARGHIESFDFCLWRTRAMGSPNLFHGVFVRDGQLMR